MNQRLAALNFISHCLAVDPGTAIVGRLKSDIHSGRLPWESVIALANEHLLTPALWVALNDKGLAQALPDDVRNYLRDLHGLSRERNAHLRSQLLEAVGELNSVGIVPVLLKGAMHLVSDMYGDSGVRIMTDIDLLVPSGDLEKSQEILRQMGYRAEEGMKCYDESHHHCAPLFRPGDYGALELHRDLLMKGYRQFLPGETALAESEPLEYEGRAMKVLSPTHRVLHNILHSQIIDRHYPEGVLPLRSLHEMVTEVSAQRSRFEWSGIRAVMENGKRGDVLDTYLYLAHRLFGLSLPGGCRHRVRSLLYYQRCRLQAGWPWLDVWGHRIGRLSTDNIGRLYDCGPGWLSVNRARLRHVKNRVLARRPPSKHGGIR